MKDLDWKSIELPFLRADPDSMRRAMRLFELYGGHKFDRAKEMYSRRVKRQNARPLQPTRPFAAEKNVTSTLSILSIYLQRSSEH